MKEDIFVIFAPSEDIVGPFPLKGREGLETLEDIFLPATHSFSPPTCLLGIKICSLLD